MLNMKLPDFLTELERVVLSEFLSRENEDSQALCEQIASCSLESREHNGYGFFTNLKVDPAATACSRENFELGNLSVVLSGQLCGFILFVRGGRIDFLEGFPLGGDEWPSPEKIEKVTHN
jgi:hypothetical protein